jgi:hypothetical protein
MKVHIIIPFTNHWTESTLSSQSSQKGLNITQKGLKTAKYHSNITSISMVSFTKHMVKHHIRLFFGHSKPTPKGTTLEGT